MKRILLILLSCLFLVGCGSCPDKTYFLEQISLNNDVSGDFFLGCGSLGTETYYYFYTNDSGAIKLHKIHFGRITIYYTEDRPKAVEKDRSYNEIMRDWEVYIPKNSIVNSYNVNIK